MKNNNAIISDIIQALEGDQLVLRAIDGKLCKFATARTKRQNAKKAFGEHAHVSLLFAHLRWAGDFHLFLRNTSDGIMIPHSTLTADGIATVHRILNTQSRRIELETESEIIKGCGLLGAKYEGAGIFKTACGRTFKLDLDGTYTAKEVRDSVICTLSWEIDKKPFIGLTEVKK